QHTALGGKNPYRFQGSDLLHSSLSAKLFFVHFLGSLNFLNYHFAKAAFTSGNIQTRHFIPVGCAFSAAIGELWFKWWLSIPHHGTAHWMPVVDMELLMLFRTTLGNPARVIWEGFHSLGLFVPKLTNLRIDKGEYLAATTLKPALFVIIRSFAPRMVCTTVTRS